MKWFAEHLTRWFEQNARDLLWRHEVTPYRVWVSEIMLQQTQVATVTPYFERWMKRFPTIESLAQANESDVLEMWSGLGYYRRAKYLHKGAKYLLEQYNGVFPQDLVELKKIPGIGDYTAGAIASIALNQQVPAIDGNAERVLSRYFAIFGDLKSGDARKSLEAYANGVAVAGNASKVNQAIMDLGASLCGKKAQCETCPLNKRCQAYAQNLTAELPQKAVRAEKQKSWRAALFLVDDEKKLLVVRQSPNKLLGGLWSLPMIDLAASAPTNENDAKLLALGSRASIWNAWLAKLGLCKKVKSCTTSGQFVHHVFTHIDMRVVIDIAHYPGQFGVLPNMVELDDFDCCDAILLGEDGPNLVGHPVSKLMNKLLSQPK